jgi:hypothetical protein
LFVLIDYLKLNFQGFPVFSSLMEIQRMARCDVKVCSVCLFSVTIYNSLRYIFLRYCVKCLHDLRGITLVSRATITVSYGNGIGILHFDGRERFDLPIRWIQKN